MIRASSRAYLARLNPSSAAPSSMARAGVAGPLLVIAGAGSGKTNTLAHRVAHLIVNGADPRRILLMTFSRRAAAEMTRRVERIAGEVLGGERRVIADALTWAGTFHGIGARLLRDYALRDRARSGLHHPRPRGFGRPDEPRPPRARPVEDREPLPDQGHLPRDLFARRQCARRRSTTCWASAFPGAPAGRTSCEQLFAAYVEAKQAQNVLDYDDLLLYWAQMAAEPAHRRRISARASTTCWSTSTRTPTGCRPRSCWR